MPTAEQIQADFAPRIRAAYETAMAAREAAFIAAPFTVCGLKLRAMSLDDYAVLTLVGNAHVAAIPRPEDEEELACFWALHDGIFLWRLSFDYTPDPAARDAFIARHLARLDLVAVHRAIGDYLAEVFFDAPRSAAPGEATTVDPLRVCFVAVVTHRLATAYGWPRAEIRALPLAEIFQYLRLIGADDRAAAGLGPRYHFDESDRLAAESLAATTRARHEAAAA